jgi:hypothetical protein
MAPSLNTHNLSLKPNAAAISTVKFLCSYGGKILPRYPDGVLRYQGGHTRVLSVDRSISFSGQFTFPFVFSSNFIVE